jgi:hypothetical protein
LPECNGGRTVKGNIAAACRYCNEHRARAKPVLTPQQFGALVRRRLAKGRWHGHRHNECDCIRRVASAA